MAMPTSQDKKINVTFRLAPSLLERVKACAEQNENRTETITRMIELGVCQAEAKRNEPQETEESAETENDEVKTILLAQITFLEKQLNEAREEAKAANKAVRDALETVTTAQVNALEAQTSTQLAKRDVMNAEIVEYEVAQQEKEPLPDFSKMGVFEAMAAALRLRKS